MSRTLSNAAKMAAIAQQTDEVFVVLLTISHPSFTQPIKVSSDNAVAILPVANVPGTISRGEEYVYLPFTIDLPQQEDSGTAQAKISIDNIDRTIVNAARQANSYLSVEVEIVLASTPDVVEIHFPDFRIEHVSYNAMTVEGTLSVDYYDTEPFSKLLFTPSGFRGMF